jgi:hypothetical protein
MRLGSNGVRIPLVMCPFFMPSARVEPDEWIHAPRLTLIDEYRGTCHVAEPFEPEASAQRDVCNCGYASGRCDRFPSGSPDAVRFSVIAEDGPALRIVYVFETDHLPSRHAVAEPEVAIDDEVLNGQIRAFAASYRLRR